MNHLHMTDREIDLRRIRSTNATIQAILSLSGSNVHRSYEECGVTFERDGRFKIVKWRGVSVAHMTPTFSRQVLFDTLLKNLGSDAEQIALLLVSAFQQQLAVPDGHTFIFDVKKECHSVTSIGENHISAFVRRTTDDPLDEMQFSAEFRVFLDCPRAHLFLNRGKPYFMEHRNLLNRDNTFPKAETYQELASKMIAIFNEVCAAELAVCNH